MNEKKGKQSIKFGNPPYILGAAAVAGPKEIDGPMARYFDRVSEDATFGKDSWEEGESEMVRQAVTLAIQKAGIVKQDIRYIFAGDLLGQLIASTFGIKDMEIPVFGLYGACSTCGEALSLASMTVADTENIFSVPLPAILPVQRSSSVFPWNMEISVPCQLPGRSREVVPLWCQTESQMCVSRA